MDYDGINDVEAVFHAQNFDNLPTTTQGFCTSAGRGTRRATKLHLVTDTNVTNLPTSSRSSPKKISVGRGSVLQKIIVTDKAMQRHRQTQDPFGNDLQIQLRQVQGDGFSNRCIEHHYPNVAPEIKPESLVEQFEDALATTEKSALPETETNWKQKQGKRGNGKKGRSFRKLSPSVDNGLVGGSQQGKKLSEIFSTKPRDYQDSYLLLQQKNNTKLFASSDFPLL